ncbi:neurofilament heavy polypeptide isoform X2 [Drosophila rhopaloa]|nr:neurofilament heavy polypeptide isoform X2 [Drosophila rhopaloa]XP_016986493.1 neurofilament heavy polypeptide isoform X2 [Drosophila rhopaloa]XP_016986494.1 neurofilament heavy polypeptide isoform X2 [Drosophila rhopaloa]
MFPNNFFKMKNFANPKTMFKSCASNDDYPSQGLQKSEAAPAGPQSTEKSTAQSPAQSTAQSTAQPAAELWKTQAPKNTAKKTPPPEPQKQGKNKSKAKKNQKNVPRTPSQTSKSSGSHTDAKKNQAKNENSKDKMGQGKEKTQEKDKVQELEKLQVKQRVPEQKKVPEKKNVVEKVAEKKMQDKRNVPEQKLQDELTPEQKVLEQKIQRKLSEQKVMDRMLEPKIYQNTYPMVKPIPQPDPQPAVNHQIQKDVVMVATLVAPPDNEPQSESSEDDLSIEVEPTEPDEPHHPLNNSWTLWYLENDRTKSWEDMLHEVTSFDTVENFWSLITHIKPPSELKMGSDYCLFKKGIRPMWEDEANVHGGRWVISLSKNTKTDLDNFWMDSMLCLIGAACDHSEELCGAVVNIRGKSNKISIWTADGGKEAAVLEIGRKLREGLRMESAYVLQYQLHKDTMVKQGSTVKSIYTL